MIQAITVFFALLLLDLVWAKYTIAVTDKAALRAGVLSSAIIILSGTAAIGYVNNHWMLIPAMAGAFCGTYIGVKFDKGQSNNAGT